MQEYLRQIGAWLLEHRGKVTGSLLGLLFGWFTLRYGFLRAVFVFLCLAAGYYVGSKIDRRENLKEIFEQLFPPHR